MRVGEMFKIPLKMGWNRKGGKGNNIFKKRAGQAGSRGGSLKRGEGLEPPYKLWNTMGIPMAVNYANCFMGHFERNL